uniref:Uncharacterized protein n=1 Tax=Plectus sambesii TaxID=2011161 RepID=A0A914XQ07_9BILA
MLDRSEAASSSIVINSPTVSPRGNSLLSRKRECIVLPLSDFPSLNRPSKRSRLHESSPFDTLNVVRHSFVPYPHASSLQTPSLYARESLETSRVTRSHNDCLPRPTVSTSNSPPNDTVESHSPHAEEAAAAAQMEQAGPSFNEDADSHSSHASEPLSFLETDELPLPVKPLFSKISFKKVSSPCIDFTISESEFARSSDVNHVRLKRLLGKPSSKDESNLLKSILKKPPTELAASIAPSFAPVNPGIYSSPSQDAPVLKLSSSIPAFPAASSFASNPEPNIFTATPLTSGSRPTSLSNARRKFARR